MNGSGMKLEVIRKLLAKAEGAATAEEAEAYNVKAAELMARHGVDAALLAASGQKADAIVQRRIAVSDPYSAEKAQLVGGIGSALRCQSVNYYRHRRDRITAVALLGYESDLERAELLFTSLLLQATSQVLRQRPPRGSAESTAAYRRTWLVGFASVVHTRLTAAEQRAAAQHEQPTSGGSSVALVLADRESLVSRAFADAFGHLGAGRRRVLSGSGYRAGAAAGAQADLGTERRVGTDVRHQLGA